MLFDRSQPAPFRIDIPVDDLLPAHPTPDEARLDRAASRDKSHGEAKASEAALKALLRTQRAEEARKARIAAEEARSEKLASLSARVEESVERKSKLVAATQAKNAYLVKRALAV
ncbi:hypothetical protein EMIHUDRAFT_250983, partial [Emiliania huxleyi CCMP1516]|uniref:Uncharacterized protein n=2 Tax=Emiliania huxleyi TaxID=2903 RepID=A0A0D3KYU6_EMIH1